MIIMRLFVGNISFGTTEEDLRDLFSEFGEVESLQIITDRETGRPRGFGFVTMTSREGAESVIESCDGRQLDGRALKVNEARERPSRGHGGGRDRW